MIYLTYNDQPSGVYFSQVTDVCKYVNATFSCGIRLVAFISIRGFAENKKKIKQQFPKAIVLPMFPKQKNWRLNKITLRLLFEFIGKQSIWSRGIFATNMALDLRQKGIVKKVVFDGRGAYEAEYREYLDKIVANNEPVAELEKRAILESDHRLAVSQKLVDYWKKNYGYSELRHSVIPCTISHSGKHAFPSEAEITKIRATLGYEQDDLVFVYSGSAADWQSLQLVDDFMLLQMQNNSRIRLILLANTDVKTLSVYKAFPDKVVQKWLKPSEVQNYLYAADQGILLREYAVTNEVASPTKFAEYLDASLQIVISESIGDFTALTEKTGCGTVIKNTAAAYNFGKLAYAGKLKNHALAQTLFTKDAYADEYGKIVAVLKS